MMRRTTIRLFIAAITFSVGVGIAAAWLYRASSPSAHGPEVSRRRDPGPVLLEVSDYAGGMYQYVGDQLLLRVYADGRAEYDVLNQESPCLGCPMKPTRKEAELTPEELGAVVSLSRRPDLWAAKGEYAAFISRTDTYNIMSVSLNDEGRGKKIVVHNVAATHPQAKAHYPPSLIELIATVWQIKRRLGE